MSAELDIHLLGGFSVEQHGQAVPGLAAPRLQALLAHLLLQRGAAVPRQQLAALFWPDSSEAQAQANLRKLLYLLYRALPAAREFLRDEGNRLRWPAESPFSMDIAVFEQGLFEAEQAARRGDASALRGWLERAAAVYKGDLLPGCYDDWIFFERERLRRSYGAALHRLTELLEGCGELLAAITYSEALLQHDSMRESAYRRLMRLHAANGDRSALQRVYQRCCITLKRELDVAPVAATQRLYQQLVSIPQFQLAANQARCANERAGVATTFLVAPVALSAPEQERTRAVRLGG